MRLFYCREPRIPNLPGCTDLWDEAAAGEARNQNKFERKERANLKTEHLDTSPLDLEVGLKVVMRNSKTNRWDVKGEVISIRAGGRSCYVKTSNSNRTYLRNRRLLRVDKTQQIVEEETFAISWSQAPQAGHSCLSAAKKPWQVKKPSYITAKAKVRSVEFDPTKDKVFYYSQE